MAVIGTEVTKVDDLKNLPDGADGLYVLAGSHRYAACFQLMQVNSREICAELIKEAQASGKAWEQWRDFTVSFASHVVL